MLGVVTRQIPKAKVRKKVWPDQNYWLTAVKSRFAVHAYMHVVHVIRCNRGCVPFEINKNFSISNLTRSQTLFFVLFENSGKETYIVEPPVSDDHKIMLRLYVGW